MFMSNKFLLVAVVLLVGIVSSASAQSISGGVNLGFPSGTTLFGFSGRYEAPINDDFKWMATGGLQFGSGVTLFTLQGGAKYEFEENFYVGAEIGPLFLSGSGYSDTRFGFTPTFGYKWDKFDFSAQYFASDYNFLSLRFAYVFSSR